MINQEFPSLVSFSRRFSGTTNAGKPIFLVVVGTYQRLKLAQGRVDRLDVFLGLRR